MVDQQHQWIVLGDLMVSFTRPGKEGPDALWQTFAKDLSKGIGRYLATSVGTVEVTSVQRKLVADVLRNRNIPTAAVTDERLVRGLITAVAWLGADIKPFAWADLHGAIEYLRVPSIFSDKAHETAMRWRSELADKSLRA
jgi:hypothetical protein